MGSLKVGRYDRHPDYLLDPLYHLSPDIGSRGSPHLRHEILGHARVVQIIFRFLPLDPPDAIGRFVFNEANDSSSSDLVRALQYTSKEDGPTSGSMEGATKVLGKIDKRIYATLVHTDDFRQTHICIHSTLKVKYTSFDEGPHEKHVWSVGRDSVYYIPRVKWSDKSVQTSKYLKQERNNS
ncbi:uncharacterized protein LOC122569066 isoform X1 [Bombus pyrosoma]|uniref:uncharacterized protein LOC122569066 isoform X1 n=1 Tax=Bombus pyrosoma TaxID=396416 RepID=UPI001CB8B369|nr:uncharacterized protein LOC122569066 isoform X1 [Bombus pyrosoma]